MIKVNGEFLKFNAPVEMERQVKLFDNIIGLDGDFSYQFQIDNLAENRNILGIKGVDSTGRLPYQINNSELVNDNGVTVYSGSLRVESVDEFINASFFANNSNWFEILNIPLRNSFNWSEFDIDQTTTNIRNSQAYSEGIVWPLVDRGALHQRSSPIVYEEDMQPFIYVKDVVRTILNQKGLKLAGDILTDSIYNSIVTTNGGISGIQNRITQRSVYVGQTTTQVISSTSYTAVTFENVGGNYFNSPNENWDVVNYRYDADTDYKKIRIEFNLKTSNLGMSTGYNPRIQLLVGASVVFEKQYPTVQDTLNIQESFMLDDVVANGNTITLVVARGTQTFFIDDFNILADSWIKVTPVKFYTVYADQLLPNISASEFLSQIFSLFCCATKFNSKTNTIHTRLFKNIERQPEVDLSPYVSRIIRDDYSEFVSDYSRQNIMQYSEADGDDIEEYNKSNSLPYGAGSLNVVNDYIMESDTILDLDFVAPFQKDVPWLGNSLPLLNYVEAEETTDEVEVTSVTDNGDSYARFNFSGGNPFTANQLVRVSGSSVTDYEGDYRILVNTAGYVILADVIFTATATATITGLELSDTDNDDQVLLINSPNRNVGDFSGLTGLNYNGGSDETIFAFAYFYLKDTQQDINSLMEALYFEPVNDPGAYQISLKEKYYMRPQSMLNDPKKVTAEMRIPEHVFNQMDSFSPIRLKTRQFNLRFYLNRVTGYENQSQPCEVELIKM